MQEQAEDAAALLDALGAAPAVLVGDGFGALVVLELLVRRPQLATAAVLADPPLFAFVADGDEALADERTLLEQALRDGGAGDAIRGVARRRRRRRAPADRARVLAARLLRRLRRPVSWSPSRRELRAIGVPVAVVTGPARRRTSSRPPTRRPRCCPAPAAARDGDVVAAARGAAVA